MESKPPNCSKVLFSASNRNTHFPVIVILLAFPKLKIATWTHYCRDSRNSSWYSFHIQTKHTLQKNFFLNYGATYASHVLASLNTVNCKSKVNSWPRYKRIDSAMNTNKTGQCCFNIPPCFTTRLIWCQSSCCQLLYFYVDLDYYDFERCSIKFMDIYTKIIQAQLTAFQNINLKLWRPEPMYHKLWHK